MKGLVGGIAALYLFLIGFFKLAPIKANSPMKIIFFKNLILLVLT